MAVALLAGQPERHASQPCLPVAIGVDQIDAPNIAVAVENVEVVVLPEAAFAGRVLAFRWLGGSEMRPHHFSPSPSRTLRCQTSGCSY